MTKEIKRLAKQIARIQKIQEMSRRWTSGPISERQYNWAREFDQIKSQIIEDWDYATWSDIASELGIDSETNGGDIIA